MDNSIVINLITFLLHLISTCRSTTTAGDSRAPAGATAVNELHHAAILELQEYYENKIVYLESQLQTKTSECEQQQTRYVQAIENIQASCAARRTHVKPAGGRAAWPTDDNTFDNRIPNIVGKLDNITQENDVQSQLINKLEIALDNETKQFETMRAELLQSVRWMTEENRHEIERDLQSTIDQENEEMGRMIWQRLLQNLDSMSKISQGNLTLLENTWSEKFMMIYEEMNRLDMSDYNASLLSSRIKSELDALNRSVLANIREQEIKRNDMHGALSSVVKEVQVNVSSLFATKINQIVANFATKSSITKLMQKQDEFSINHQAMLRSLNDSYNEYLRAKFDMVRENMKLMFVNKSKEKDAVYDSMVKEMQIMRNNSIHLLVSFQRKQRVLDAQVQTLQQQVRTLAPLVALQEKYQSMQTEITQCQLNIHHLLQTQETRYRNFHDTVNDMTEGIAANFSREISSHLAELERDITWKLQNTTDALNLRTRLVEIQTNVSEAKLKKLMNISDIVKKLEGKVNYIE